MANTFKNIKPNDVISTRTLLHEAIPLTGTIVSGTYGTANKLLGDEENVKNFSHGMFQSVYDYPYLSSSANHIFDITVGYANSSDLSASANEQNAKKINLYNQMAQVCMGYDKTGSIQLFDQDGDLASGTKMTECMFFNFSRLLVKDEIKKGSFELELGVDQSYEQAGATTFSKRIKITDTSGSNGYKTNSPVGEYGVLFASSSVGSTALISGETLGNAATNPPCGLIFYQAGIVALSGSVFNPGSAGITVTATNAPTATNTATIVAADGTSKTFECHGSTTDGTLSTALFSRAGSKNGLDNFKTSIEASSIGAKVTVSEVKTIAVGFEMTISQNTPGATGNKTVTNGLSNYTFSNSNVFSGGGTSGILSGQAGFSALSKESGTTGFDFMTGSSISGSADAIRNRVYNMQFNNTTELNSTIYFCRVNHNEYNYSGNPTYLASSKIVVKDNIGDQPISYITSVGLYSADGALMAVGKLSEPLRKDPSIEYTLRARLDY